MPESGIKAVIFDLGNVLIDFDHALIIKNILSFTSLSAVELKDAVASSGLTERFEKGEISGQGFYLALKDLIDLRLDYPGFVRAWNEIFSFTSANQKVMDIALLLRKKFSVGVLTNTNSLHLEYVFKHYQFLQQFDRVIASCEVKARKPEPAIYQKACAAVGVLPQEIFYCDDRPELVQAAANAGWNSVVYRSAEELKIELARRAVLS